MGIGNILTVLTIIAVAVWIFSNLFRGAEDARGQQKPFPPREDVEEERRPRSLASDVDRFLVEIQRRKQEAEERQRLGTREQVPSPRRPQPARTQPAAAHIPTVIPVAQPARPKPKPKPAQRVHTGRAAVVEEVVPVAFAAPAALETISAMPAPEVVLPAAPAAPATRPAAKAPPPAAAPLVALLRSQQTLRTAVLLQEVLSPPRCRRGQNGGRRL